MTVDNNGTPAKAADAKNAAVGQREKSVVVCPAFPRMHSPPPRALGTAARARVW